MDDLRIQIVNYKTKQYLLRCLETIFGDLKDIKLKFTVAILDNDSGDDLSDIPKKFSGQPIEIYQNKTNVGFGAGHNILAKHGDARYLLFINPDTEIVEPHTIARLFEQAQKLKTDVIGPRLITDGNKTQRWDHGELRGFRAWASLNTGHSYWRERKNIEKVAWTCGAFFMIKKESFDRLGGFDENIFLYKEEEELCWRLREAGGIVIYDPEVSVFHHGGVVAKKSVHMKNSTTYFLKKHFSDSPAYLILVFINRIMNYRDGY